MAGIPYNGCFVFLGGETLGAHGLNVNHDWNRWSRCLGHSGEARHTLAQTIGPYITILGTKHGCEHSEFMGSTVTCRPLPALTSGTASLEVLGRRYNAAFVARAHSACPPSRVGQHAAIGIATERSATTRLNKGLTGSAGSRSSHSPSANARGSSGCVSARYRGLHAHRQSSTIRSHVQATAVLWKCDFGPM